MNLPHLAQKLFNTPLAIHPQKAEVIVSSLTERLGITQIRSAMMEDDDGYFSRKARKDSGYDVLEGIAIIPVYGTLVQKLGTLRPYSGMTGYDGIRRVFLTAVNDPEVKGICLDIDSPGGEVAGCFDLVDLIYAERGKKPIHAILSENAFSAAYAIASAADKIYVPRTGGVGSVGVIVIHCDWSQRIKDDGLKVSIITYGNRKAESNPYVALSDEAKAAIQHDVDEMGRLFVSTVSRNRGLSETVIRNTQAACYLAAEGVHMGLADVVASPDVAFQELMKESGVI
ncbi:S49 family peptidase [Morganella morganii]|uniref:S49 family peptidase n=1 Tax=Morganella morganii TaxID=582 RepID=UPI0006C4A057|nr:S49 family peptidase [Morganella morganii]MBT0306471.1 S49 family peptidase [Morganella morganii subsp. morganii]KOO17452.1 serine peptidase [Morganella morganii]MBT0338278.1 S49 family peptidase [Morganella morganii subsp. morganii]PCO28256.1 serine peptidase [Morganella morganii]HDT3150069.1 S49 family peptidase [Morganella morganii subsp. morganii]